MTDRRVLRNPARTVACLPRGALVILRDYDHPQRESYARLWRKETRKRCVLLLVAGDPALARRVQADGVHVPEYQLAKLKHWKTLNPRWFFSASAHSLPALLRARYADAVLISPVFPTDSHPNAGALGVIRFRHLVRRSSISVWALGGISARTLPRLQGAGIAGIAGIRLFDATAL
jgi:thiamine-phosphate pyrophosphorylase